MYRLCCALCVSLILLGLLTVRPLPAAPAAPNSPAAAPAAPKSPPTARPVWQTHYATAFREASAQGKMLLVVFHAQQPTPTDRHFESKVLADPSICEKLRNFVCLKLPTDAKVRTGGKDRVLTQDESLELMKGRPGLVVIDLAHKNAPYYQCVVSAMPLEGDACYSVQQVSVLLDLPPGTFESRAQEYVARARQLAPAPPQANVAGLAWHGDYTEAHRVAQLQKKMLFILFYDPAAQSLGRRYESEVLCNPAVRKKLAACVLARLPLDAQFQTEGRSMRVLEHPAFEEMLGREGAAMLDFVHPQPQYFGCVVGTFPFLKGQLFSVEQTLVMLDLPPGTLTQRTLIYAVRTHPDRPASTAGELDPNLVAEAESHSDHQASIRLQGHHNWTTRFHRINALLGRGLLAREVCAESWPGENLLEAAIECVRCWRLSSGHWSAVCASQSCYGYDMKRGSNGTWYATGIFGGRGD